MASDNNPKATSSDYKVVGKIRPIILRRQGKDYVPRLSHKLGTVQKGGITHYTQFHCYCYPPNFEHPFSIKISLYNPAGKAFCEMPLEEFDMLIHDLQEWRIRYDIEFQKAMEINETLAERKDQFAIIRERLARTDDIIQQISIDKQVIKLNTQTQLVKATKTLIDKLYLDPFKSMANDITTEVIKSNIAQLNPQNKSIITNYLENKIQELGLSEENAQVIPPPEPLASVGEDDMHKEHESPSSINYCCNKPSCYFDNDTPSINCTNCDSPCTNCSLITNIDKLIDTPSYLPYCCDDPACQYPIYYQHDISCTELSCLNCGIYCHSQTCNITPQEPLNG